MNKKGDRVWVVQRSVRSTLVCRQRRYGSAVRLLFACPGDLRRRGATGIGGVVYLVTAPAG